MLLKFHYHTHIHHYTRILPATVTKTLSDDDDDNNNNKNNNSVGAGLCSNKLYHSTELNDTNLACAFTIKKISNEKVITV